MVGRISRETGRRAVGRNPESLQSAPVGRSPDIEINKQAADSFNCRASVSALQVGTLYFPTVFTGFYGSIALQPGLYEKVFHNVICENVQFPLFV